MFNFTDMIRELRQLASKPETNHRAALRIYAVIAILDSIQREDWKALDIIIHSDFTLALHP